MPARWARIALILAALGCGKPKQTSTSEAPAASADPLDQAMVILVGNLQSGDYEALRGHTVQPLTHDLSAEEFHDLSAIVQWLGTLDHHDATKTDRSYGGGQRWYELSFEKGTVELELSIDEGGKLIGFQFGGDGFTEAEHGVLAEPWREFKVYDFTFLDTGGSPLPEDAKIPGKRVDYEIVVGGIEAMLGEHHLTIEKIVLDPAGNEVFHEPIEFDAKFDADASGIPRGEVRGYLEVPGPGKWEMDLRITDNNAHRDIEYRHAFETVAAQ